METRQKGTRSRRSRTGRISQAQRDRQTRVMNRVIIGMLVLILVLVCLVFYKFVHKPAKETGDRNTTGYDIGNPTKQVTMPQLDIQLLTINEYSRPGIATDEITGVVVHYTANPGSSAQNNRDYFENLKDTQTTSVSSNFIVGLEGEIIQCVPTAEVAYASNERNHDTVSIECCHPDESGKFTDETYDSVVELVAFLCGKFDLTTDDIIRHFDVTGKSCPKYFVDNEAEWALFKQDVAKYIAENGE